MFDTGRFSKLACAAAVVGVFSVGSAAAATCDASYSGATSISGLVTSNVWITQVDGQAVTPIESTACAGRFAVPGPNGVHPANDLEGMLNAGLFGNGLGSDWTHQGQGDFNSSDSSWSVDFTPDEYQAFAISLFGGNNWAVYLFDFRPDGISSGGGTYSMAGLAAGASNNLPGLSNMQVFTWGDATVIPLPATGWLMLSMLGLGGVVAHRKRKQMAA